MSGGPSFSTGGDWDSENSDSLWIARYNVDTDQTELHINIGDNGNAVDALVIGATISSVWTPIFRFSMDGATLRHLIANGVTLTTGSTGSALSDLQTMLDGNTYDITEATGAPGINLEVDFTGVTQIKYVIVQANYNGAVTHAVRIQLYNYDDTAWDTIDTISHGLDQGQHFVAIPNDADYISGGAAIVRLYHTETGNASHDLYVDYVALGY